MSRHLHRVIIARAAAFLFGAWLLGAWLPPVATAQDRDTKVRNDRQQFADDDHWIYNDLDRALREARESGKPVLAVYRCIPCESCHEFDEQVGRRDAQVRDLLDQFVCVRLVHANGMDLSLFQFDYDLSFAAFFLNADRTVYGRFGTRSAGKDGQAGDEVSLPSFRAALQGALELHRNYPQNRAALQGKQPQRVEIARPEDYRGLSQYKSQLDYDGAVARSCIHCHQVREAQRQAYREQKKPLPESLLYPFPLPDAVGLSLDREHAAQVKEVASESPGARAGFLPGDELTSLNGQRLLSIADVQWVLHHAPAPARLTAEVRRQGQLRTLTLELPADWRQNNDIAWRPTSWDLRRMGGGGMVLEALPDADRRQLQLPDDQPALRIRALGQYGQHATARRAGFQRGDVLLRIDGRPVPPTESGFLALMVQQYPIGQRPPVEVLRNGKRVTIPLPMQ